MNSAINTYAFNHNPVESAAIGVLGFVAHPLNVDGNYFGTVKQGGREVGAFRVRASAESKVSQADIDLSTYAPAAPAPTECCQGDHDAADGDIPTYEVESQGYLVLYASNGPGRYQVTLGTETANGGVTVDFDSATLKKDDLFVVTLIRPGVYRIDDTVTGAIVHVTVQYPPEPQGPYVQPEAVTIRVATGFDRTDFAILPTQGMVFQIDTDNHAIVVTLETPDDGPGPQPIRWTNPDTGLEAQVGP